MLHPLFASPGIIAILRDVAGEDTLRIIDIVDKTGFGFLEIALNGDGALDVLAGAAEYIEKKGYSVTLGAGTVLNESEAEKAVAAGAEFLFSPVFNDGLQKWLARSNPDLVYIPGVYTPNEIWTAYRAGCKILKLFPAAFAGPGYVKTIREPFRLADGTLPFGIIPSGGVNVDNVQSYRELGVEQVAVGASVFNREAIAAGDWSAIEKRCSELYNKFGM